MQFWFGATNLNSVELTDNFSATRHGFYWMKSGAPITIPITFRAREPNLPGSENCLELTEVNGVRGFNDAQCVLSRSFICQQDSC